MSRYARWLLSLRLSFGPRDETRQEMVRVLSRLDSGELRQAEAESLRDMQVTAYSAVAFLLLLLGIALTAALATLSQAAADLAIVLMCTATGPHAVLTATVGRKPPGGPLAMAVLGGVAGLAGGLAVVSM